MSVAKLDDESFRVVADLAALRRIESTSGSASKRVAIGFGGVSVTHHPRRLRFRNYEQKSEK